MTPTIPSSFPGTGMLWPTSLRTALVVALCGLLQACVVMPMDEHALPDRALPTPAPEQQVKVYSQWLRGTELGVTFGGEAQAFRANAFQHRLRATQDAEALARSFEQALSDTRCCQQVASADEADVVILGRHFPDQVPALMNLSWGVAAALTQCGLPLYHVNNYRIWAQVQDRRQDTEQIIKAQSRVLELCWFPAMPLALLPSPSPRLGEFDQFIITLQRTGLLQPRPARAAVTPSSGSVM